MPNYSGSMSKKYIKNRNKSKKTLISRATRVRSTRSKTLTSKSNNIRVFSYNISWESMTGAKAEWPLCSNNTNTEHPKHNSVCVSNIANVIEENPADFVLLQEATDYKNLIKGSGSTVLSKMNYEEHNSGKDGMVLFWNKKYKKHDMIKGDFELGRPWMAILFSNGLCVVNIHMGHYSNSGELKMLNKMVNKIMHHYSGKISRMVIGGDFNNDIKKLSNQNTLNLGNILFYHHPKKILTCCIKRYTHYDHVLDTLQTPLDIIIPDVHHMASDHKPILVTLS